MLSGVTLQWPSLPYMVSSHCYLSAIDQSNVEVLYHYHGIVSSRLGTSFLKANATWRQDSLNCTAYSLIFFSAAII